MKFFNTFFTVFLTILVITACSDSPAGNDNGFEPVRYGNFLQTSEYQLDWIGNNNAPSKANTISAQGDSTYFESPNGNALRIAYVDRPYKEDLFAVFYTDSSYSFAYFDSTLATSEANFINPFSDEIAASIGISDELVQLGVTISNFRCDSTYNFSDNNNFEFHILDDNGGIYESIIVDTDGVEVAMRAVGC